jgi:hypothetical protein
MIEEIIGDLDPLRFKLLNQVDVRMACGNHLYQVTLQEYIPPNKPDPKYGIQLELFPGMLYKNDK